MSYDGIQRGAQAAQDPPPNPDEQYVLADAAARGCGDERTPPRSNRNRRTAVLVVHGMGQQIPFETLDRVAQGLRAHGKASNPAVRAVWVDDDWLYRIELDVDDEGQTVETHLYEVYWAPLTEGKATIRDVLRFLAQAGLNGIWRDADYRRWMFGRSWHLGSVVSTIMSLTLALLTVCALVVINTAIVVVVLGSSLFRGLTPWLTQSLFVELTAILNVVVAALALLGVGLGVSHLVRKLKSPRWLLAIARRVAAAFFALTVFVVVASGFVILLLFPIRLSGWPQGRELLLPLLPRASRLVGFNHLFAELELFLTEVGVVFALVFFLILLLKGTFQNWTGRGRPSPKLATLVAIALACIVVLGLIAGSYELYAAISGDQEMRIEAGTAIGWILPFVASLYIRSLLVQYVGDVAIYITPYHLDRFYALRQEIKERACKVARAIYAQKGGDGSRLEYDEVILMGHSLGSVVAYDVFNRMANEDAAGAGLRVVHRTPLFLTFGSPLDKTAFVFSGQQRKHSHEAREVLAAAVQPMITDYRFRPERWINIYSPWDLISGRLDFYDEPETSDSRRVCNLKDPDATTFLLAHNEYWSNSMLYETLLSGLRRGAKAQRGFSPPFEPSHGNGRQGSHAPQRSTS